MDTLTVRRVTRKAEAGSEIIELAIVLPILVLLLLGIVDFAFLFQRWEVVTNATREGARLASLGTSHQPSGDGYEDADVTARVTNYLTSGGLNNAPSVLTTWDTDDTIGAVVVDTVTVSVSYTSDFIFFPWSINLISVSEMRRESGS